MQAVAFRWHGDAITKPQDALVLYDRDANWQVARRRGAACRQTSRSVCMRIALARTASILDFDDATGVPVPIFK